MKRGITIILAAVMALGLGLGGLSVAKNAQGTKEFISDGYILDPSDEEYVTDNVDTQYYFSAGAKYKEKYGSQIVFKSSTGDNQTIDSQHFIHYNDGSLGAFTKGVLMDVSEINDSNYGYYSLTPNTVLIKNGNSYEMTSRGEAMNITEFIWKISDTDYMLVSPNITLNIGGNDVNFSDYVQLTYVDNGIVRLTHQTGTYQTVAADSKLVTQKGTELNLVGKEFIVDGEPVFSLDDMAIDDDSYIDVDENIKDQPTIPTFNVINGKDGANGTDGTDGEQGIEGEEGQEGEQGSEGDQGAEGSSGSAGGNGSDGVEGDTGIMGYDGAEGIDGKSAENAENTSDIVSADLKVRPTITVDAGEESSAAGKYNVTPNRAEIALDFDDSDRSLIPGTARVKVYDKATMQLVNEYQNESTQAAKGAALEEIGSAVLDIRNLDADTEYLIVVEGEYAIDEDGNTQQGVLFQKVFKTESIGISLAKDHVTDSEISVVTKITGTVDSYNVIFYYYDDTNTPKIIARFPVYGATSGSTFTMNDSNPTPNTMDRPDSYTDVTSNTKYYAALENLMSGSQQISTKGSEVELMTLKETPYDFVAAQTTPPTIVPVPAMQPSLSKSDKTHTMTVNLNNIVDKDQGISGYKVELINTNEIRDALNPSLPGVDLTSLVPSYSKEMAEFPSSGCTFSIPDTDNSSYRARVIAYFNDNEKDAELTTLFSDPVSLSNSTSGLTVSMINVTSEADRISGIVRISDGGGNIASNLNSTEVCNWINAQHPLTIEITGEFADTYSIVIPTTDHNASNGGLINSNIWSYSVNRNEALGGTYWDFSFRIEGLHKESWYSIRAIGPQDTDGSRVTDVPNSKDPISGAEATTYLAGKRVNTKSHEVLALMSKKRTAGGTKAFEYSLYVAPTSTDPATVSAAHYTAGTMDSMVLTLSRFDGVKEKTLGNPYTIYDPESVATNHTSQFETEMKAFSEANSVATGGLELSTADNGTITVSPSNFGILDHDSELYAGGLYTIKVTSAKDYTGNPNFKNGAGGNEIEFKDGMDLITFEIDKNHVRSNDPNRSVDVELLTNASADSAHKVPGLSSDTVVGIRFGALYSYTDISEIYYDIYEIPDGVTITDSDLSATTPVRGDFISRDGKQLTESTNSENNLIYSETTTQLCTRVLSGIHRRNGNEYSVKPAELYFEGTSGGSDYIIIWNKPGENLPNGTSETVLQRGKRYIVTYRVLADHTITPHGKTVDHEYPQCVYEGTNEPLYRSAVINLNKQTPIIERYPSSSTEVGKETWKYRVIDPDGAIVTSGGNATLKFKEENTFDAFKDSNTGTIVSVLGSTDVSAYSNQASSFNVASYLDFADYTITGLSNGKYYRLAIPFKLLNANNAPVEYITSKPIKHVDALTSEISDIYLKGLGASSSTAAIDKYDDGTAYGRMKPIVNEGNYRYKLTFQGTDLNKVAAFRVEVSGIDNGTPKTVVYDPVYIKTYNTNPYGYAYLDQRPLAGFVGGNITFKVTGYYSKGSSGFEDFVSTFSTDPSSHDFDDHTFWVSSTKQENLFAFRTIDGSVETGATGETKYKIRENGNTPESFGTGATAINSLFVPGENTGAGLAITNNQGEKSNASFNARYYKTPFVLGDDYDLLTMNGLSLDESGIHLGDEYYTVEKLEKTSELDIDNNSSTPATSYTVKLTEIVSAIERDTITAGATTASFNMILQGYDTPKIFAEVTDLTLQTDVYYSAPQTEGTGAAQVTYYNVDPSGTPITAQDDTRAIIVKNDNGVQKAVFNIRGLSMGHRYGVMFFVIDSDGNKKSLYSSDLEGVDAQYQIETLSQVTIMGYGPAWEYSNYENKYGSISFAIPGNDGRGMLIKYKIVSGTVSSSGLTLATFNPDNYSAITTDSDGQGTVTPNDPTGIAYYSDRSQENNNIFSHFNPGSGPLSMASSYTAIIYAVNATNQSEVVGFKFLPFTVPSTLDDPAFRISFTSAGTDLRTQIVVTDENKSIMNQLTVELFAADDTTNVIGTSTVDLSGDTFKENITKNVTFSGLSAGNYLVRVTADVDNNNDRTPDKQVMVESMSNAGISATASLGLSATTDTLELNLTNLSNFRDVTKMIVTAYNAQSTAVFTTEIAVDPTETSILKQADWSAQHIVENTWYTVQVQFRNAENDLLGNAEATVKPTAAP